MTHPWAGFERPPAGVLFVQRIDLRTEMGLAYERSLRFEKALHVHDRILWVFPRGGTSMRVTVPGERTGRFKVTQDTWLSVPAGVLHDDHWDTEVYDTLALLPSDGLLADVAGQQLTSVEGGRSGLERARLLPRSHWLDVLLGEYFEERVLQGQDSSPRLKHLEALLVMEAFRLASSSPPVPMRPDQRPDRSPDPADHQPSSLAARAVRHLEARLFAPMDLDALALEVGASRSSLLRHFKTALGMTPGAYVLGRRLDEAAALLRAGDRSVKEVAFLVGYQNVGAFSEAFARRFGHPPSSTPSKG